MLPVFICRQPEACAAVSECIERSTHRSSAKRAVCGNKLLIGKPLWPCCENGNGDAIRWPIGPSVRADLERPGVGLAMVFRECRLGIEGIDLAWPAVHEEEDGMFRPGGKARRPRAQRRAGGFRSEEARARHQIDERQPGEPATGLPEEFAPRPSAWREVGSEPGHGESLRIDKFIEIENDPAEMFE